MQVLLIGGTSETAPIATALLQQGYAVLVSTATQAPLELPPEVRRRAGRLDAQGLQDLFCEENIRAVIDACHPFATAAHEAIRAACETSCVPLVRFQRTIAAAEEGVELVSDHTAAIAVCAADGRPVFLTIGSRNLALYVEALRAAQRPFVARVLDDPTSRQICTELSLTDEEVIFGRGPFDVEANCEVLKTHRSGVLVSKHTGDAGGFPAKVQAAHLCGCRVVAIACPEDGSEDAVPDVAGICARLTALGLGISRDQCSSAPWRAIRSKSQDPGH